MENIFDLFRKISEGERSSTAVHPVSAIIAGLGNPGDKYSRSRHNTGFLAVDYIAQRLNIKVTRLKFKALCGEAEIDGTRALIMKPETYMNNSGEAIREAAEFYKIPPERIIIICDDVNLPCGTVRIRAKGSDGGQKGLRSIILQLNTDTFPRIRVGVGEKPSPDYDLADWVLSSFSSGERELVFAAYERVFSALPLIISGDIATAQSKYNG